MKTIENLANCSIEKKSLKEIKAGKKVEEVVPVGQFRDENGNWVTHYQIYYDDGTWKDAYYTH